MWNVKEEVIRMHIALISCSMQLKMKTDLVVLDGGYRNLNESARACQGYCCCQWYFYYFRNQSVTLRVTLADS